MRKIGNICLHVLLVFSIVSCNQKRSTTSIQIKKLNYPSASSVEYLKNRLYVMGDDATNLLILDTNLNIIDSIAISAYPDRRIPKDKKPDLEASTLYLHGHQNYLLLFGSMSVIPEREWCWRYNLLTKKVDSLSLQSFYSKIKGLGIEQVNIEGAAIEELDHMIIANRGNKSYPKNHLFVVAKDFWKIDSTEYKVSVIPVEPKTDSSGFNGVSGLFYFDNANKLIMSVSTEDTRSVYEDGAIGKSYLWIIDNFSAKKNNKTISPDRIIDLEEIDPRFKGQKIESVTGIENAKDFIRLVLVADNDNGTSTIFKMSIKD